MTEPHPILVALRSLCETAPEMIIVTHEPWTERYVRAEQEIERVIFDGKAIGLKTVSVGEPGYEIVVWNEPENDEIYGLYSVIRVFASDQKSVSFANLFGFYDGKDPSSEKFKTEISARKYMESFGKYEELKDA